VEVRGFCGFRHRNNKRVLTIPMKNLFLLSFIFEHKSIDVTMAKPQTQKPIPLRKRSGTSTLTAERSKKRATATMHPEPEDRTDDSDSEKSCASPHLSEDDEDDEEDEEDEDEDDGRKRGNRGKPHGAGSEARKRAMVRSLASDLDDQSVNLIKVQTRPIQLNNYCIMPILTRFKEWKTQRQVQALTIFTKSSEDEQRA
jgi:hypothetical protein